MTPTTIKALIKKPWIFEASIFLPMVKPPFSNTVLRYTIGLSMENQNKGKAFRQAIKQHCFIDLPGEGIKNVLKSL